MSLGVMLMSSLIIGRQGRSLARQSGGNVGLVDSWMVGLMKGSGRAHSSCRSAAKTVPAIKAVTSSPRSLRQKSARPIGGEFQIFVAILKTRFDLRSFMPFVPGGDHDPIRLRL